MKIGDEGLAFIGGESGDEVGIEAARHPASGGMVVRDGKSRTGPMLVFTGDQWRAFLSFVALGDWPGAYVTWANGDEVAFMTVPDDRTFLRFTAAEMAAFARGVADGLFALPREPEPAHT